MQGILIDACSMPEAVHVDQTTHHSSSFVGRRWVRFQFQLLQGTEHCIADAAKIDLEALEAEEAAVLRTTTQSGGLQVVVEELGQRGHGGAAWLIFMQWFLDRLQTDSQTDTFTFSNARSIHFQWSSDASLWFLQDVAGAAAAVAAAAPIDGRESEQQKQNQAIEKQFLGLIHGYIVFWY